MEFLFENIHKISNRRGLNCNAQQCNFITFYFLDERKGPCYKHVIMQKWILSKKKQTQLRTMRIPTATSG